MDFEAIKGRLARLDTACIYDANKKLRVMDPGIRPINQGLKMIGIAHTVQCKGDFLSVIKALHDAKDGEVLVIDSDKEKIAVAGELFTYEAQRKGLAGIVIDGGCRDVKHIRQTNFPVYARYITPMAGTASRIFSTQATIQCGGVPVSPGDIIFGDDDGVLIISEQEITEILEAAESIQQKEEKVSIRIKANESLLDMLNFSEHYAKISQNQESKLTFKV